MNEKEKLIELIKQNSCPLTLTCDRVCEYIHDSDCYEKKIADHLLENGVRIIEDPETRQYLDEIKMFKERVYKLESELRKAKECIWDIEYALKEYNKEDD